MPLGGLAPLPVRLGGSALDGLSPSQFNRLATDLAATMRTLPIFVARMNGPVGAWYAALDYIGRNGGTLADAPGGIVNFFDTNDHSAPKTIILTERDGTRTVYAVDSASATSGTEAIVEVYGHELGRAPPSWADYGGALDKRGSEPEGEEPLAWSILGDLRAM